MNQSPAHILLSVACRAEQGRGLEAQLSLENSSPDIYDYDGPSLVDLLWNINKLNRFQIIVTTEFKPQTVVQGNGRLSPPKAPCSQPSSPEPVLILEHSNSLTCWVFGRRVGVAV